MARLAGRPHARQVGYMLGMDAMESQYLQMMRLQLLGVLADIFMLPDLARLVKLAAPATDRPLVDAQGPGNFVVVEL